MDKIWLCALISSEFSKIAGEHEWWELLTDKQQDEYLKSHPESDLKKTPNSKATKTNELLKFLPSDIKTRLNEYHPGMRAWVADKIIGPDLKGQWKGIQNQLTANPNDASLNVESALINKMMNRKLNLAHGRIEKLERWFHTNKPDLNNHTLDSAIEESRPWRKMQQKLEGHREKLEEKQVPIGDTHFYAVELYKKNELDSEGAEMTHCVGSYCKPVKEGKARIFSIKDPKGNSVATIEVRPNEINPNMGKIQQIKGRQNKTPAVYKDVIQTWLDKNQFEYTDSSDYKRLISGDSNGSSENNQQEQSDAPKNFNTLENLITLKGPELAARVKGLYYTDNSDYFEELKYAPIDLLDRLGENVDPENYDNYKMIYNDFRQARALGSNEALPKSKLFWQLIKSSNNGANNFSSSLKNSLATNPNLTDEQRYLFMPTKNNVLGSTELYRNPSLNDKDIDRLIWLKQRNLLTDGIESQSVYELNQNENMKPEWADKLLDSKINSAGALIGNKNVNRATVDRILNDVVAEQQRIENEAEINKNDLKFGKHRVRDTAPWLDGYDRVKNRKDLSTADFERIADIFDNDNGQYNGYILSLIRDTKISPEKSLSYKKSKSSGLRETVAQDTRIPFEQIADMIDDEDKSVRASVKARRDKWKVDKLRKNLKQKEKHDEKLDQLGKFKQEMQNLKHISSYEQMVKEAVEKILAD